MTCEQGAKTADWRGLGRRMRNNLTTVHRQRRPIASYPGAEGGSVISWEQRAPFSCRLFTRPDLTPRTARHRIGSPSHSWRTGRDGTGRDGTGRDGTGRDGTRRDGEGTRRDETRRDGTAVFSHCDFRQGARRPSNHRRQHLRHGGMGCRLSPAGGPVGPDSRPGVGSKAE